MRNCYDLVLLSHHKCATNWLRAICKNLADANLILVDVVGGNPGPENSTGVADKRVLLDVNAARLAEKTLIIGLDRNIHFVRDPRDAFVSNYFSWRYSHKNTNPVLAEFRANAKSLTVEEGMLKLVDLFPMGRQLADWTDTMWDSVTQVRYEDLLSDFAQSFKSLLGPISATWSNELVNSVQERTTFNRMSGRTNGSEDPTSHFRKGKAGDWQNHFTDRLSKAFFARHGWMGGRLGYW